MILDEPFVGLDPKASHQLKEIMAELCRNDNYAELKKLIGLDENSHVLLISTEGDTDPERYRKVVWDGAFPNE